MIGVARVDHVAFTGSVARRRRPSQRAAARALHRHRARARRQGSGLCPRRRRPRRRGRGPGRRRLLQHRPVLLRGSSASTSTSASSTPSSTRSSTLTRQYRLGDPLDPETTLGPMVRTGRRRFVRAQVGEAVGAGAQPLVDPQHFAARARTALSDAAGADRRRPRHGGDARGDLRPGRRHHEGEGRRGGGALMNDSRYGLTASIWTRDLDARRCARRARRDRHLFMNRCDYLDPALAWTGVKDSGPRRPSRALGFEHLTRPKSFHLHTSTAMSAIDPASRQLELSHRVRFGAGRIAELPTGLPRARHGAAAAGHRSRPRRPADDRRRRWRALRDGGHAGRAVQRHQAQPGRRRPSTAASRPLAPAAMTASSPSAAAPRSTSARPSPSCRARPGRSGTSRTWRLVVRAPIPPASPR